VRHIRIYGVGLFPKDVANPVLPAGWLQEVFESTGTHIYVPTSNFCGKDLIEFFTFKNQEERTPTYAPRL